MSLLPTLLAGAGGGGGGSGSVTGVILSPVACASTTALTVTYANGSSGVGATLTNAGVQAAISLDGISPTVGQRVLIKDQSSGLQNGVYTVTTVGTGATNWVLTRATDFDQAAEMTAGTLIEVVGGSVNAGTVWELTTTVATVGTNSVSFISINITTKIDQSGAQIYAADAGSNDTYVITLSPAPSAYTTGMMINFKANTANTGAATLNVNGLGAKTIVKNFSSTLADNDILAGQDVQVIYDGTNFQMLSPVSNVAGAAAAGTSIQTVSATITGKVSIASTAYADVTGLTATITPASSSNKVLVFGHISMGPTATVGGNFQIVRTSTAICVGTGGAAAQTVCTGGFLPGANVTDSFGTIPFCFLDSPATGSAVTYKIQAYTGLGNASAININATVSDGNSYDNSRGTSTITLQEIKG